MLEFEHPDYLWFLLSVPVLAVLFYGLHRWRRRLLATFASTAILKQLAPEVSTTKRSVKQTMLLLGLGFLILAAVNPQVGTRLEEVKREGIDLFVALDVSLSMKAEDIRPNRLEKAKRDVSALLTRLAGDRVGLIVFAGDAFVQFPLTSDYSAADLFISAVDVDAVPTPGTMISSAIELALKSFPSDLPTQKAIIIVSDGENNEGDVLSAVEKATSAGVKIYTVGMGTPDGGPIPLPSGGSVDYKRDRQGSIVLTKLDESTLRQLAAATGGSYRRATSGGNEIDEIFDELSTLEKTEFGSKELTGFESVYQYPLALALLFLLLDMVLSERRGTVLRWLRRLIPATAGLVLTLGAGASLEAQTHRTLIQEGNEAFEEEKFPDAEAEYKKALQEYPDSRVAQFNLGDAYYKQQRYEEARQVFNTYSASSEDRIDAAQGFYNLGNTLFQSGKLDESIEAYKQVLRLNPLDEDARHNLELARRKKQEQQQQKKQDQQKQNENKEQENQQDRQQEKNKQDQQQQQQQQQNKQQPDQQQQQPQLSKQQQIPKEQADRILEALRNSEKEIQKQLRKREGVRIRVEKDW